MWSHNCQTQLYIAKSAYLNAALWLGVMCSTMVWINIQHYDQEYIIYSSMVKVKTKQINASAEPIATGQCVQLQDNVYSYSHQPITLRRHVW